MAVSLAAFADVEPEKLDFGPFELANPTREARVKLGPALGAEGMGDCARPTAIRALRRERGRKRLAH